MKRTQVPILMYHALNNKRSVITIPPATFSWQMRWLYKNDYRVIPLRQLVQSLRHKQPLPARSIVLTFDDGFESIYTDAFPILTHYKFPATIFLVSGYCGQYNNWPDQPSGVPRLPLMTWSQIREMDRYGIEFGGHTITHPWLDRLSPKDINHEILVSKSTIEAHLGHAIDYFVYPYGRYTNTVRTVVCSAYRGACTTQPGLVNSNSYPFELERIEILDVAHPLLFQALSSSVFPLYIALRRLLRKAAAAVLQTHIVDLFHAVTFH